SIYFKMITEQRSSLLMCGGYPFIIMIPYKIVHYFFSFFVDLPPQLFIENWWATSAKWFVDTKIITNEFSWIVFFQHHDFILLQNFIELTGIFLGFSLIKKYFPYGVALLFLLLYGLHPLSIEDGSSVRPEWLQSFLFIFSVYLIDKIIRVEQIKKIFLYSLFGCVVALGFLVKFNGLVVYAILLLVLIFFDHHRWKRTLMNLSICVLFFLTTISFFIMSYHFPTTGTKTLSYNVWVLGDKTFQFIPKSILDPKTGITTKRILAIDKALPAAEAPGAATFFEHIDSANRHRDLDQVKNALYLLQANERELDSYLQEHSYNLINHHTPILKIAYYIGLSEYKSLVKKLYFESIKKYPGSFMYHTMINILRSFISKHNSSFYFPNWKEVTLGRNNSEPSKKGYVRFSWSNLRLEAFAENIVWLPGVRFFTNYFNLWPSLWFYWLLSFISFSYALKRFKMNNFFSLIVISNMIIVLTYLICHHIIYIDFRTKDWRGIMCFMIFLTSIGIYHLACFFKDHIHRGYFHLKKRLASQGGEL
ncbi:MAG: hypothetical protein K1060chlam5_01156, partial [Candidatus Anoxychlamydiales bacterium]|nr:hypothetical protein [Candidatus Anoxychlamydiales bacterium]